MWRYTSPVYGFWDVLGTNYMLAEIVMLSKLGAVWETQCFEFSKFYDRYEFLMRTTLPSFLGYCPLTKKKNQLFIYSHFTIGDNELTTALCRFLYAAEIL